MLKDKRGVTVVELLLTIAVFGLAVPSLYGSVVFLGALNKRAELLTQMNIIAENKFESLRSQGYNSIIDGPTDFSLELPANYETPKSADYVVTTVNGQKNIVLNISLSNRSRTYSGTYQSIVSELGVAQ